MGCNRSGMSITSDFKGIFLDSKRMVIGSYSDRGLLDCKDCTSYFISIINNKDEISNNIRIRTSLFDNNYKTFDEGKVEIVKVSDVPGKPEFDIIIEILGGDRAESVSFGLITETYNTLTYDCDLIKKQFCNIIQMDSYIVKNTQTMEKVSRKLGFARSPPMPNKETKIFKGDINKKEYIEHSEPNIIDNLQWFIGGDEECSTQNPAINPMELI